MKTQLKQKDPLISKLVGIIPSEGENSVLEVREIRKKLSEKCKHMSDEELLLFLNSS